MKKAVLGLILVFCFLALMPLFSAQEECKKWSECKPEYDVNKIISGDFSILGKKTCIDNPKLKKTCSLKQYVKIQKIRYCYEDYVQIYDYQNNLIGRILEDSEKLDIRFTVADEEYCNFCFNGILDYDEEQIDCGGAYCPPCIYRDQSGTLLVSSTGNQGVTKIEDLRDVLENWKNEKISIETAARIINDYFS